MGIFKRFIGKIIFGGDVPNFSYSQGGEDIILQTLFRSKLNNNQKGFYVDIGAYHPSKHSNTYLLYKNGWRGINIDATPGSMKAFKKKRPQDINIEAALSGEEGMADYYIISRDSTMNSFSRENLERNGMLASVTKTVKIKTYPLSLLLDQYCKVDSIDLLNIDAEGMDYEILKSNDWNRYRPTVIAVELNVRNMEELEKNQSAKLLISLGYQIVAKNVLLDDLATVFFKRHF